MAGFDNEVMYADNWDFRGNPVVTGQAVSAGDLPIGTGGSPAIKAGQITSTSLTVSYSDPNITIETPGGGIPQEQYNVDVGPNVTPDGSGVTQVTGTSIFSSGNIANTLTLNVEASANTFMYGQGSNTNVAELGPLIDGQLIIGDTGNSPKATTLASADSSITISNGAGTIDLSAGAAVPTSFATDSGTATPAANLITFTGANGISTSGAGSTVTIDGSGVGGAWTLISTATASSSATVEFTGLTSSQFIYKVFINNLQPGTDASFFFMRTSSDNGVSFDSGASDYGWIQYEGDEADSNPIIIDDTADSELVLGSDVTPFGSAANELGFAEITIYNPSDTIFTYIQWFVGYENAAGRLNWNTGWGRRESAADVDAIQFLFDTGNIATGTFKLYGITAS